MLSAFIKNIFAARISIDYDDFVLLLSFCLDFSFFRKRGLSAPRNMDRVEQLINQGALNFSNKTKLRLSHRQTLDQRGGQLCLIPMEKAQRKKESGFYAFQPELID